MKTYTGSMQNHEAVVTVDGQPLDPRFDLARRSPTGFAWGYGGSGPAQLAIALLADCEGAAVGQRFFQDFKWQVIALLEPDRPWTLTGDAIRAWVAKAKAERGHESWMTAWEREQEDRANKD